MWLLHLAWKDFLLVVRDKKALVILLAMPLILTGILGFALGGVFSLNEESIERVNIAVVVGRQGGDSAYEMLVDRETRQRIEKAAGKINLEDVFINDFLESPDIKKYISYKLLKENAALEELAGGKIDGVVVLPGNFSREYVTGRNVSITVITGSGNAVKESILHSAVKGFADSLSIPRIALSVLAEELVRQGMGREVLEVSGDNVKSMVQSSQTAVNFSSKAEKGKQPVSALQYYSAAMAMMFILFAAGFAANSFVEEREEQTMARLLLSGRNKWLIAAGKGLGFFLVALMQMSVMIVFTSAVLGVSWGSHLPSLAGLTLSVVYAVAGLGIFTGSIVKTRRGVELFQMLVIQVMALLGGSFMPLYVMPGFLKAASAFTINGQALSGYLRLMEGAGPEGVTPAVAMLLAGGTLLFALGGALLKPERGGC